MSRDIDRRDLLKGIGGASIFGLAGCVTQSSGDGGGGGSGGSTSTATDTGTEQETVKPIDAPGYDDGDSDSDSDGGGGGSGRTVKLGVLMPETGDLASVGQPIRDGALLPAIQLEGADVPVSIDTQVEDTATDPQQGIQAANALVNAGYPMVTGPASSGVNLQVSQQVFIPNSVVGCSPSSTSPTVTGLNDNDFIFRTAPSDALQGRVMAQVASDTLGSSTASTMYVNNDYGQALSDSFVSSFGGDVNEAVAFEKEKPSYTSELETALSGGPDLLVIIGYPASGIQIFRDFYADFSDSDVDILVTDGLKDPALPDEVGNEMANVTGTAPLASGPGRDFYDQLYEDEFGEAPGVFTAQAYDASAVLILANAYAGSNDGAAVRDALREVANPDGETMGPSDLPAAVEMAANGESVNYTGASSSVNFDENGDMVAVSYQYFGFDTSMEGNIEELDTIEFGG